MGIDEEAVEEVQERSTSHRKKLLIVVLGVAAVVGLAGTLHQYSGARQAKFQKYEPHGSPEFVNYVSTQVPRELAVTGLCEANIVSQMCGKLNDETIQYYDNAMDRDRNYIHALELSEALSVNRESVIQMFNRLNLRNWDPDTPNSVAVSCMELCQQVVASFPHRQVPSHADVGCYSQHHTHQPVCNVDVSPPALQRINFRIPTVNRAAAFNEEGHPVQWETQGNDHIQNVETALNHAMNPSPTEAAVIHDLEHPPMNFHKLKELVANQFRIFPVIEASTVVNSGANQFFGVAPREPQDSGLRRLANSSAPRSLMTTDDWLATDWEENILRLAVTAKAFVNSALTSMEGRQIPDVVTTWYGNNFDDPTRARIKQVLRGLSQMLGDVDYVYPGNQCQPRVYGYVYPNHPQFSRNSQGQYIVHLCDHFMSVDDGEKIETLTHEGTHHLWMQVDDRPWPVGSQDIMYGRWKCKEVAALCSQGDADACAACRENADNYCYFINEAAHAGGHVVPTANSLLTGGAPAAGTSSNTAPASTPAGAATEGTAGLFGSFR